MLSTAVRPLFPTHWLTIKAIVYFAYEAGDCLASARQFSLGFLMRIYSDGDFDPSHSKDLFTHMLSSWDDKTQTFEV